jgi:hypothetical protein
MFTEEEFEELVGFVPNDFTKSAEDFWKYILKRLSPLSHRIRWVFTDRVETKKLLLKEYEVNLVQGLVNEGAQLRSVEEPTLFAESQAWFEMMQTSSTQVVYELYKESRKEISKHIVEVIEQSLRDRELGVLFIDASINLSFPDKMRIIRMFPFNPNDYLNRYRVKLRK